MSLRVMNSVWEHYQQGGSEKLTLLALADWCDDNGEHLYPSIRAIAKKICASESQARRIVHNLIDEGVLTVIGNHSGGHHNQSRQYRINLSRLMAGIHATPRADATPCFDAHAPLHRCASPLAPMPANTSLTINESPRNFAASNAALGILDYLNEKARKKYRPVKTNLVLIEARLKEGATVEECKAVIDAKILAWSGDPYWSQYLRPETLFNARKYAQYAGGLTTSDLNNIGGETWE